MNNSGKPFVAAQLGSHVRIGVSPWGRMAPDCLVKYECDVGYELEVFTFLMTLINFTVEIKYSTIPGCGDISSNGQWNGILGMLQRNEIDITGNLCQIDESRRNVSWLKHSWPVRQDKQAFLLKAPETDVTLHMWAPFSIAIWLLNFFGIVAFVILFAIIYKVIEQENSLTSLSNAVSDAFKLCFGFNCDLVRKEWFYLLCFVGFIQLLYATLVTSVVLKHNDILRPFSNHAQLADNLLSGKNKLLDYHDYSYVQCYSDEVCKKLRLAQEINKHFHFNSTSIKDGSFTNDLLQLLVDHSYLVLVRSRHTLLTYLDKYPERWKLWLIVDESSGFQWFSYFYNKNFKLSKLLDKALILMGDSKDNIFSWYISLSDSAVQSKKITSKLSETTSFELQMFMGLWLNHSIAVIAAVFVFFMELVLFKFKIFQV